MSYIDKEELIQRMQVDAPMNWTDTDFELGEEWQYKSDMEIIESCAEVKVIPIPPRATNEDILTMLLKMLIDTNKRNSYKCELNVSSDRIISITVSEDWCKEPYIKE